MVEYRHVGVVGTPAYRERDRDPLSKVEIEAATNVDTEDVPLSNEDHYRPTVVVSHVHKKVGEGTSQVVQ